MLEEEQIKNLQQRVETSQEELTVCEVCRILGDWNRYRMMKTLIAAKELCVGDIAKIVGISMSATSQHLRILEMSGLVESERMGQTICYRPTVSQPKIKALIKLIS
jgi:ArsR family transcriptional regulator